MFLLSELSISLDIRCFFSKKKRKKKKKKEKKEEDIRWFKKYANSMIF